MKISNTVIYMNGSATTNEDMKVGTVKRIVAIAARTAYSTTGLAAANLYNQLYCFDSNTTTAISASTVGTQAKGTGTIYLVFALSSGSYSHVVPLNYTNWTLTKATE